MKVKKRGGRSRDGLIAYPEFMPRDIPMTQMRMPIQGLCPLQCWVVVLVRDGKETQLENPC
jgi:hypothetical protein